MAIKGTIQAHTFDVVVVGCGIAGLSAAVSAAERGARVCVLERSRGAERGGNSKYTEAYLRMTTESEVAPDLESGLEASAGGFIDPELAKGFLLPWEDQHPLLRGISFTDPDVLTTFVREILPAIAWLKGFRVRFEALPTQFITQATPRLLPVGGGQAIVDALGAWAEEHGVTFRYQTTGRKLLQTPDGAIRGVRATSPDDGLTDVEAPTTVLASGGFEGNPEMLTQYLGPDAYRLRPVARGGLYNKGEGIRMALEIGAAPAGQYGDFHAEPIDPRSGGPEPSIMLFPYGILVNREGQRFVDEASDLVDRIYEPITRTIWRQPGGLAYFLTDAKVKDVPVYTRALRTEQPPIEAGSLHELAREIEVDFSTLDATVRRYNAAVLPGRFDPLRRDGLATRGLDPPKSNWARPIDQPPFIAYPMICSIVFTFGGLKVNAKAQVVSCDGHAIPGLYAAGETVGMYYGSYLGSTSVLKAIVFGRLAGIGGAHGVGR